MSAPANAIDSASEKLTPKERSQDQRNAWKTPSGTCYKSGAYHQRHGNMHRKKPLGGESSNTRPPIAKRQVEGQDNEQEQY
jgi:hypothetical protein